MHARGRTALTISIVVVMIAGAGVLLYFASKWIRSEVKSVTEPRSTPQPPPPSDREPMAPGPDNTIKHRQSTGSPAKEPG